MKAKSKEILKIRLLMDCRIYKRVAEFTKKTARKREKGGFFDYFDYLCIRFYNQH